MNKLALLGTAIFLSSGLARAQTGLLTNQIDAVAAVQDAEKARQQSWYREQAAAQARALAAQQAAAAAAEHRREAAARAERDEAIADKLRNQTYEDQLRQQRIEEGNLRLQAVRENFTDDKHREQKYEDKQRELALREQELRLKALETRVSRENDYVDRELRRGDAETDVVQSRADSTRALSAGTKTFMEDIGTAAIRKESGFVRQ